MSSIPSLTPTLAVGSQLLRFSNPNGSEISSYAKPVKRASNHAFSPPFPSFPPNIVTADIKVMTDQSDWQAS